MVVAPTDSYKSIDYNGKEISLDQDGFLVDINDWHKDLALLLANREGLVLTEAHWEIITFCRTYYKEHGLLPIMRVLTKAIAKQMGADKARSLYLYSLFSVSPVLQVARIGGLPKPPYCI